LEEELDNSKTELALQNSKFKGLRKDLKSARDNEKHLSQKCQN
jgi:hypothetical protein